MSVKNGSKRNLQFKTVTTERLLNPNILGASRLIHKYLNTENYTLAYFSFRM